MSSNNFFDVSQSIVEELRYVRQVSSKPAASGFVEGSIIFDTTEQAFYESVNDAWELLDLNAAGDLLVDKLSFNTTAAETAGVGELAWNDTEKTLDLGVSSNVTIQVGQEEVIYVKNASGVVIPNGAVVYVTGAQGANVTVAMACATAGAACAGKVIGVATEELGINEQGFVATHGIVRGLNTNVDGDGVTLSEGDALYLSTTLGEWVKTVPSTPNRDVRVGYVTRKNANNGELFVSINNGFNVGDADNVDDSSASSSGSVNHIIFFDSSAGYYKTQAILDFVGDLAVLDTVSTSDIDDGSVTAAKLSSVVLDDLSNVSASSPTVGDNLRWDGSNWVATDVEINGQTGTSYTLALSDVGKLVTLSNASGITLTVPPESSVAFEVGAAVAIAQTDSGSVSVASGSGVTITSFNDYFDLAGEGATASLVKLGSDAWLLFGNLK